MCDESFRSKTTACIYYRLYDADALVFPQLLGGGYLFQMLLERGLSGRALNHVCHHSAAEIAH